LIIRWRSVRKIGPHRRDAIGRGLAENGITDRLGSSARGHCGCDGNRVDVQKRASSRTRPRHDIAPGLDSRHGRDDPELFIQRPSAQARPASPRQRGSCPDIPVSHHNSCLHWAQRPRGRALRVSGPVARKSGRCASASPAAGWPDKRQHGLRLAAKTCESQDAGTGHVSSRRLAPRTPRLGRSIWISRYGLNRDGRMARSASDATGPVESVSVVLAGLRHAQAGDRGGSWDGASGSG
jgi:hypothetical protein